MPLEPHIKKYAKIAFGTGALMVLSVIGVIGYVQISPRAFLKPNLEAVEPAPVALVLGASVKDDGTPSDALYDRIMTGVELYQAKKAEKILLTGDDGGLRRDEITSMKKTAIEAGVPEADILTDGEGYRTYESCKRAVQVFNIRKAIIVTQQFHLPRALYLCSHVGMEVQGLAADKHTYIKIVQFTIRDLLASAKAWWDIHIQPPDSPVKR